ncbi:MAG: hypothetical protein IJH07_05455 [Ruminococcus sp.]|nr:hypothetical protein [Ruminococcus sp.]
MVDFEDEIIGAVASALRAQFPGITVFDETNLSPETFPCVCIEEIDNYTYKRTIDTGSNENHARLAYEVNVFSNRTRDKHGECRRIFAAVSDAFTGLGFTRNSMNPMNINQSTARRLVGRFTAVISKTGRISRR